MSEAAPEGGGGRPGGGGMSRPFAGIPTWGWVLGLGVGGGVLIWYKLRGASSAGTTATTEATTAAGAAPDDTTSTSEYEQISAELTGLEGTQEALLAAVKDLQGDKTTTTGGAKVTVPDIVGERGSAARAKISAAGLKYKQDPATTPAGRETEVTSQDPHAGTKVAKNSEVTAHVKVKAASKATGAGSSGGGGSGGGSSATPASSVTGTAAKAPATKAPSGAPATKAPTKKPAAKVTAKPAARPRAKR
jgi:hypothetical protein